MSYLSIPLEVFLSLDSKEVAVYLSMRSFSQNGKGICFASADQIATRAKISRQTVYKIQRRLVKLGYIQLITKKPRAVGGKPVSHYSFLDIGTPDANVKTGYLPVSKNGNISKLKRDTQNVLKKDQIKEKEFLPARTFEKPLECGQATYQLALSRLSGVDSSSLRNPASYFKTVLKECAFEKNDLGYLDSVLTDDEITTAISQHHADFSKGISDAYYQLAVKRGIKWS